MEKWLQFVNFIAKKIKAGIQLIYVFLKFIFKF